MGPRRVWAQPARRADLGSRERRVTRRDVAGSYVGVRGRLRDRAAAPRSCGTSRSGSGRWSSPTTSGGCTSARRRRSAASPCSVGLLIGMLVAWRSGSFTEVFGGTTEPIGVVVAAVIIVAGRRHRRPPRRVGAGQGGRHGAGRQRPGVLGRVDLRVPGAVRGHVHPVHRLVVPDQRDLGAGHDHGHQLHRRSRRLGGRHRGHLGRAPSSSTRSA